jgi:FMN-dependent NADH-azoreductase
MDTSQFLAILLMLCHAQIVWRADVARIAFRERAIMSRLLYLSSSALGEASATRQLGTALVARLRAAAPGLAVVERDLAAAPLPHLDGELLAGFGGADNAAAARSDALITELKAADVIVIGAPMYNFSIPSTLKAWIDHVARAGHTFTYTANGPQGLLKGKRVFVVSGRGGVYSEGANQALDFQEAYLRGVLGFIGLTDVTVVRPEGLKLAPDAAGPALARAQAAIDTLVPLRAAA